MGSTINPRARGGASLKADLRAGQDDRQQIRRLFNPTPKPQPAAPVAGGGISGVTRCDAWEYETFGVGVLYGRNWNFSSLYDSTGPSVSTGDDPSAVYVSAAGWYQATLNYNVAWTASPVGLGARIAFTGEDADNYPSMWEPIPTNPSGPYSRSRQVLHSPWVLMPAGGYFLPSLSWNDGPSVGSFHHFTLDVTKG